MKLARSPDDDLRISHAREATGSVGAEPVYSGISWGVLALEVGNSVVLVLVKFMLVKRLKTPNRT